MRTTTARSVSPRIGRPAAWRILFSAGYTTAYSYAFSLPYRCAKYVRSASTSSVGGLNGRPTIPTARWRDHKAAAEWGCALPPGREAVVYCAHGHQVSEAAAAVLRGAGASAFYLEGGIEAWRASGAPLVAKSALERYRPNGASQWVTRESPIEMP